MSKPAAPIRVKKYENPDALGREIALILFFLALAYAVVSTA